MIFVSREIAFVVRYRFAATFFHNHERNRYLFLILYIHAMNCIPFLGKMVDQNHGFDVTA